MEMYTLLDSALQIAITALVMLVLTCLIAQIGYYLIKINNYMSELKHKRDKQRQEEAEKIAKNIYGED